MTDYNVMPDLKHGKAIINEICQKNDFIRHFSIGTRLCGNKNEALQIGNTNNRALNMEGCHGTENLTVLTMLKFAEECA